MRHLWQQHDQEEDWGYLLIDAHNAFNEENYTAMIWYVQHEWPSGAQSHSTATTTGTHW